MFEAYNPTIKELRAEVERLKEIVKELTAALKLLTEKDERAKEFVVRVEQLLSDVTDAKDVAIEERDEAVDALKEELDK